MMGPDLSGAALDGRYRLVSLLGVGGMGQVYEGTHLSLDRRVAIKVLPSHLSEDDRFRARFAREARAVARITHRNVVQIMDFGTTPDGLVYFVMEFLDGRDLGALLREKGRLPWPRARHLLLQAASALKAAHAHAIIHRDIKPGNCFVLDLPHEGLTDVVKLLDFGIAKVSTELTPVTLEGEIVGTASYLAPEQARGGQLDARSDVYSLGIMAYEMLAGRVPFVGINIAHVVTRHLFERPDPLHRSVPDIHPGVEAIVLRAIAKEPADRFQSMAELEAAIAAVEDASIESVPTRVRLVAGSGERMESGRNVPTVVLHEPEAKAEPRVPEDSFEDAETPDPLVLMPRFGEPYPLRAEADLEASDPAIPADEEENVEPLEEARPTGIRLATDPPERHPNMSPKEETVVEVASTSLSLASAPEPPFVAEVIDVLVAAPATLQSDVLPIRRWDDADEREPRANRDTSSTRARLGSRSRLLGLAILLASAAGVAAMTLLGEPERRSALDAHATTRERNESDAEIGVPAVTVEPNAANVSASGASEKDVEDSTVAVAPSERESLGDTRSASTSDYETKPMSAPDEINDGPVSPSTPGLSHLNC